MAKLRNAGVTLEHRLPAAEVARHACGWRAPIRPLHRCSTRTTGPTRTTRRHGDQGAAAGARDHAPAGAEATSCRRRCCRAPKLKTDAELFDYACANAKTDHHPVGTCRIGRPSDPDERRDARPATDRPRRPARRRCLGDAVRALVQHQRPDHHGRREGGRPHPRAHRRPHPTGDLMQIRLPQADGTLKTHVLKAQPIRPQGEPAPFNRTVYAAAHVVIDPLATVDPWDASPVVDWDATLAFREHLYQLGFKVAEAMDTAQRGMGVDWPVARELIQRSPAPCAHGARRRPGLRRRHRPARGRRRRDPGAGGGGVPRAARRGRGRGRTRDPDGQPRARALRRAAPTTTSRSTAGCCATSRSRWCCIGSARCSTRRCVAIGAATISPSALDTVATLIRDNADARSKASRSRCSMRSGSSSCAAACLRA